MGISFLDLVLLVCTWLPGYTNVQPVSQIQVTSSSSMEKILNTSE